MNDLSIYVITWNQERYFQDFIDFYRSRIPDCKIVVYDNESTDNTVEIAKSNNCEVISFSTGGKMDEKTLISIRNTCWQNATSKWIIVVDDDEWVEVSQELLDNADWNINKCIGYEMFGEEGDTIDRLIYGCPSAGYCKSALFNRLEIFSMGFEAGSHKENPKAKLGFQVKYNPNPVALYHTKWRSPSNGFGRAHNIAPRVSGHSKSLGWNFHYGLADSIHQDYYNNGMKNRIKVR